MSDTAHAHHEQPGHGHAAHPHPNYVKIWGILIVLLLVSISGPFLGIQIVTLITAFGIAFVKAYLVATRFMHIDAEKPVVWYFLGACLAVMVLFLAAVSPDVMHHKGARWENLAAQAEVERREKAHADGTDHIGEGGEHHAAEGAEHGAEAPKAE